MKKLMSISLTCILILSCGVNREKYSEELINNLDELKELLQYIEINYEKVLNTNKGRNRVVFGDCNELGFSSEDYVCDYPEVLVEMDKLNISEIRFEKVEDSCTTNNQFREVYFKRDKEWFDPVVYYLYEYCGNKGAFESRTIYYEPVDDFWGLYIDSNLP